MIQKMCTLPCRSLFNFEQSTLIYWMSSMSWTSTVSSVHTVSSCNLWHWKTSVNKDCYYSNAIIRIFQSCESHIERGPKLEPCGIPGIWELPCWDTAKDGVKVVAAEREQHGGGGATQLSGVLLALTVWVQEVTDLRQQLLHQHGLIQPQAILRLLRENCVNI